MQLLIKSDWKWKIVRYKNLVRENVKTETHSSARDLKDFDVAQIFFGCQWKSVSVSVNIQIHNKAVLKLF
jgi:hypothetical protein